MYINDKYEREKTSLSVRRGKIGGMNAAVLSRLSCCKGKGVRAKVGPDKRAVSRLPASPFRLTLRPLFRCTEMHAVSGVFPGVLVVETQSVALYYTTAVSKLLVYQEITSIPRLLLYQYHCCILRFLLYRDCCFTKVTTVSRLLLC